MQGLWFGVDSTGSLAQQASAETATGAQHSHFARAVLQSCGMEKPTVSNTQNSTTAVCSDRLMGLVLLKRRMMVIVYRMSVAGKNFLQIYLFYVFVGLA